MGPVVGPDELPVEVVVLALPVVAEARVRVLVEGAAGCREERSAKVSRLNYSYRLKLVLTTPPPPPPPLAPGCENHLAATGHLSHRGESAANGR